MATAKKAAKKATAKKTPAKKASAPKAKLPKAGAFKSVAQLAKAYAEGRLNRKHVVRVLGDQAIVDVPHTDKNQPGIRVFEMAGTDFAKQLAKAAGVPYRDL